VPLGIRLAPRFASDTHGATVVVRTDFLRSPRFRHDIIIIIDSNNIIIIRLSARPIVVFGRRWTPSSLYDTFFNKITHYTGLTDAYNIVLSTTYYLPMYNNILYIGSWYLPSRPRPSVIARIPRTAAATAPQSIFK